ncbi:hypothetical protein [Brachybacterium fresconis]|uniref:Uncharacterized protein n=1 Tax=Brachybacterium fresconis TaxID=173363 RepID=A0ABS4YR83_9MICO|nr:hypothetical protein [Brachybacterium fresconis]MBP2411105.1 hypothetical protein [Brachybacterium fresconis]
MTQQTLRTERDAAGAYEILAAATSEPEVLVVLTDEELIALAGTEATELAGTPFLDTAGLERDPAAAVALRSLVARGLVVLEEDGRENEGEDLGDGSPARRTAQLDRTLAGLLTLRSSPLALANLTRRVADQTTSLMVYLFPQSGVLEEFITADGFHHFSVPARQAVPGRLARYADAAEVAGAADGGSIEGTVAGIESSTDPLAARLQDTRALTVLTTAHEDVTTQVSIMATSDGVLVMDTPQDEAEQTLVREIGAGTLLELLDGALPRPDAL